MSHYEGKLIYSVRDEIGPIEVVDQGPTRTLYFGSRARQSTMFLQRPAALALAYTHCMATGWIFTPAPASALVLGLGGGSLARFLLHYMPSCRVDAVEMRPEIARVARDYFALPADRRLQVHLEDGAAFLRRGNGLYDWLMVDLHDSSGMAPAVFAPRFFADCRRRLSAAGLLLINLWSGARQKELDDLCHRLEETFDGRVLYLPVAGKNNCVALGFCPDAEPFDLAALRRRATRLEQHLEIGLPALLEELVRFNQMV